MTIRNAALFLLLFLPSLLVAQDKQLPFTPSVTGRFNFMGLIDVFDANFSIGTEYRFGRHWSTGTDAAYIMYSAYKFENKGSSGYILRPFLRYYPKENEKSFFEVELHYKWARYKLERWVGRDVENGIPSYEELTNIYFKKQSYGFHIKAGSSTDLSARARMEYYVGIGVRWKTQGYEQNDDAQINESRRPSFNTIFNAPNYAGPVIPLGVRLLITL